MQDYRMKAKDAIIQRDATIPQHLLISPADLSSGRRNVVDVAASSSRFTGLERQIITSSVKTLLENLRQGVWSARTVTQAFLESAAVAQQLTNCLTALRYDSAIRQAEELDQHFERTGETVGPLHGLPISLKDCFVTPPTPSALGLSRWAGESTESLPKSTLVEILHQCGAVIHAKTNVPVGMMMMETDNLVTGPTTNPYNLDCSPGGSSGGEGALLALHGSPMGIGTDIGGSIRIPSSFCGLYSLKPSFGRLPTFGARSAIPGNDFIYSVNRPMACDIDALELYSSAVLGSSRGPWTRDPKCIPIPWRSVLASSTSEGKRLKLAFMPPHDGIVHAHPPVARALSICRRACTEAGHEIVEWSPERQAETLQLVEDAFFKLGGPAIAAHLAETGEPWFAGMHKYADAASTDSQSRKADKLEGVLTAEDVRAMNLRRNELQKKHLERWTASNVDVIIAPVSPWTAVREGLTSRTKSMTYIGYTAVWSLLDVSVGTVPITKATATDTWDSVGGRPLPFGDQDCRIMEDWDADFYEGTPVCLQLSGGRLEEEKIIGVMRMVDNALKEFSGS